MGRVSTMMRAILRVLVLSATAALTDAPAQGAGNQGKQGEPGERPHLALCPEGRAPAGTSVPGLHLRLLEPEQGPGGDELPAVGETPNTSLASMASTTKGPGASTWPRGPDSFGLAVRMLPEPRNLGMEGQVV